MTKYSALEEFLKKQDADEIPMTFIEIEKIIGAKLPPSAYKHRPWWSNNPSNSVITNAWLNAGFKTEQVDMEGRHLVFRRVEAVEPAHLPSAEKPGPSDGPRSYIVDLRHPLLGSLKGTIRITPGTDLTAPADPEWGNE